MRTGNEVQELWIANLKSHTSITSLLANNSQIKESQWQGTIFSYPAVRFDVDFLPAINRCLDTAMIVITVFSAQKSSDEASTIAGAIQSVYHGIPFTQNGVQFPIVIVEKVDKPERNIYAWESRLHLKVRVS